MSNSADVNAGDDILASQYNNLRADVLNPTTGHKHDGSADGGVALGSPLIPKSADLTGDGSAGNVTISALTELDSLVQYNDLIVDAELRPASGLKSIIIMVKGTLTINAAGSINADGRGGSGAIHGGAAAGDGTRSIDFGIGGVLGGVVGNPGTVGERGPEQALALHDAGENFFNATGAGGGNGAAGAGAGGSQSGGEIWAGGGGGGNGAAGNPNPGQNGGAGGGSVFIFADTIVVNASGRISANGEDGSPSSNEGGAGGGGGGGLVYLAYKSLTNNGSIQANGGAGGTKVSSGDAGGAGATGILAEKVIPG